MSINNILSIFILFLIGIYGVSATITYNIQPAQPINEIDNNPIINNTVQTTIQNIIYNNTYENNFTNPAYNDTFIYTQFNTYDNHFSYLDNYTVNLAMIMLTSLRPDIDDNYYNLLNLSFNVSKIQLNITSIFNTFSGLTQSYYPFYNGSKLVDSVITQDSSRNVTINSNTTIKGTLNVTDTMITQNINVLGNVSIKRPYAMFSDVTTQQIKTVNIPQLINFSTIEDSYQVNILNKTNISVNQNGDYLIELSAIVNGIGATGKNINIWIIKNGINIPRSNTIYTFKSTNSNTVLSIPFIIDLNTTDIFQVVMSGEDVGMSLLYLTNTSLIPETPSIIMTMTKISEVTP